MPGNPALYDVCGEVTERELRLLPRLKDDLRDTLLAFRRKNGRGQGDRGRPRPA